MAGVSDIIRMLMVGGASGAAGAGVGAAGSPILEAIRNAMGKRSGGTPVNYLGPDARESAMSPSVRTRTTGPGAYEQALANEEEMSRETAQPMTTEEEMEMAHKTMDAAPGAADEAGDPPWYGNNNSTTPTQADLAYLRKYSTDGILADFYETYPEWTREDLIREGINPSKSPDQYAMTDEDWEEIDESTPRSTRIDER